MRVDVVAFYVSRGEPTLHEQYMGYLDIARQSVERQPDHRFVVLTNPSTELPDGIERVDLADDNYPLMLNEIWAQYVYWRLNHDVPVIFTAFDCLVNRDIREVFEGADWDVGITYRKKMLQPINNVLYMNPVNHLRARAFLLKAYDILRYELDTELHDWMGDQEAIWRAVGQYRAWEDERDTIRVDETLIKYLPCEDYNWFPKGRTKLLAKARPRGPYVIHFKGMRKQFMRDFWEKHY